MDNVEAECVCDETWEETWEETSSIASSRPDAEATEAVEPLAGPEKPPPGEPSAGLRHHHCSSSTGDDTSRDTKETDEPARASTDGDASGGGIACVDEKHARPLVNMTAAEFAEAKGIILDLLGWGVPAEYLVRCGVVAREALFYAFTELNLRLPGDFDAEGIERYDPPGD